MLKDLRANHRIKIIFGHALRFMNITNIVYSRSTDDIRDFVFGCLWKVGFVSRFAKFKAVPGNALCVFSQKFFDIIASYRRASFQPKVPAIGQDINCMKEAMNLNIKSE